MSYICEKPAGSCPSCGHYRYDEEYGGMACYAQVDEQIGRTFDGNAAESERRESEVFQIPARRCKRCNGLLTSAKAIKDGYGSCCLRKMRQEERAKEEAKNQCSLFDTEDMEP